MIRKTLLAASATLLLTPLGALALSLGNIQVDSALNEPFRASIPIRGAKVGELDELRARLGDDVQFSRAGLDRPFVLTRIKFKVRATGGSRGVIDLTTHEPLAEPFLNFLVDATWSRGRVLREYTVLLDPPVYGSALARTGRQLRTVDPPASPAAPAPAAPVAPAPAARSGPLPDPTPEQIRAATGTPVAAAPRRTPSPAPAPRARAEVTGDSYGPVQRGETLWSIADRVRPSGTSIQAMMLALLRANPEAFNIDNINALKTGAVLRIPREEAQRTGRAEALAEVTRQHALWDEYRASLGRTVPAQPAGSTGTASTSPAPAGSDATTTAGTGGSPPSGELTLVGGSSAGGGAASDVKSLRDELSVAQEQADSAQRQNDELRSRLDEAESLVGDLQRLVSIKEDQLAALQGQLATKAGEAAGTEPAGTSATAAEQAAGQVQAESESSAAPMEASSSSGAGGGSGGSSGSDTDAPSGTSATMEASSSAGSSESTSTETAATSTEGSQASATAPAAAAASSGDSDAAAATSKADKAERQRKLRQAMARAEREAAAQEPPSMLDTINDLLPVPLWSVLAALGVGLVGIGGLRFARARKAGRDEVADVGADVPAAALAGGAVAAGAAGSNTLMDELEAMEAASDGTEVPDMGDLSAGSDSDAATIMNDTKPTFSDVGGDTHVEELDDDPLAEVNVYLAYERFEQAEELVRDAIVSYPDREDYRLKLVEVFYASKDTAKFEAAAVELRDAVGADHAMMGQVQEWWSDLGAGHSLFDGGAAGPRTESGDDVFDVTGLASGETQTTDDGADTGVDFDLTFETPGASGEGSSVDFDLGAAEPQSGGESSLDFDLGDVAAAGGAAAAVAGVAAAASAAVGAGEDTGEGTGLDFDVGGFDDAQTVPSLRPTADEDALSGGDTGGETGLDFDLGAVGSTDAEGIASGAETGLDFDLPEPVTAPAAGGGSGSGLDFDLGDTATLGGDDAGAASALDFDLGAATGVGDEAGAGSALDFDLGAASSGGEGAGAASALDFDLGSASSAGEASALDFDLGDTAPTSGRSGLDLDFDLGDSATGSGDGQSSALDLDLDLGDTASLGETQKVGDGDDETSTQPALAELGGGGSEQDLDLDLGDGGDDSLGMTSSLDLDLGTDFGEASLGGASAEPGPVTEIGVTSGTGLDLPEMQLDTLEMNTQPEGAFETVKLQAVEGMEDPGGVDTEFRDIFGAGGASGSGSGLDLDLGEEGGDDFISPDSSSDAVFPDTEFLLPDMGQDPDGDLDDTLLGSGGDEMQTKLDLAQAYVDMGDPDGARALLDEVVAGGDDEQRKSASQMLDGLA